jgi:hypothetical protein
MKLRERQRFFEEVFQHDVDVYLSSAHLQIHDYKRRERSQHHTCPYPSSTLTLAITLTLDSCPHPG